MNRQGKILGISATLLLLTSIACNALVGLGVETPTPDQVLDEGLPPTETPASTPDPTETPPPEAFCPQEQEGTARFVSLENGFCLLYPEEFEMRSDSQAPGLGIDLIGPLLDPDAMETIAVFMQVTFTGEADGLDSLTYADRWQELYLPGMGRLPQSEIELDGYPGVMLSGLPGFAAERGIFVVVDGNKYRITLSPEPDDYPELAEPAHEVWDTVTGSIHFFPPQNDRVPRHADDVCPIPSEGTLGYTVLVDGYCLLYPSEFHLDPEFPNRIVGGPLIDDFEPWGEIYTSLTTGTFGYFDVESPIELLQERVDSIDPDSIEEIVIGGYPAVIFRNTAGPWASRQAMILVDGFIYTIVAQPAEPVRYPDGIPHLERIWDVVTGSLAFFDPWR